MCVSTAVETSHERMGPAAPTHALPRRAGLRVGVPPPPSPSVLIGHASSHPRTNRTRLSEANRRWRAGERVRNLQEGCLLQQDTRRSGPRRVQRDETCPISTEGGTRRVHFVREGGGEWAATSVLLGGVAASLGLAGGRLRTKTISSLSVATCKGGLLGHARRAAPASLAPSPTECRFLERSLRTCPKRSLSRVLRG
jgi:hypothetical protein